MNCWTDEEDSWFRIDCWIFLPWQRYSNSPLISLQHWSSTNYLHYWRIIKNFLISNWSLCCFLSNNFGFCPYTQLRQIQWLWYSLWIQFTYQPWVSIRCFRGRDDTPAALPSAAFESHTRSISHCARTAWALHRQLHSCTRHTPSVSLMTRRMYQVMLPLHCCFSCSRSLAWTYLSTGSAWCLKLSISDQLLLAV